MQNPMIHLYASCHRGWMRRWLRTYPRFGRWYGVLGLLYAVIMSAILLSAGYTVAGAPGLVTGLFLEILLLGLLGAGGFTSSCTYGGLAALRQGRALDEILTSGVTPSEVVDGLAEGAVRSLFPLAWIWWALLLGLGAILSVISPWGTPIGVAAVVSLPLLRLVCRAGSLLAARGALGAARDWLVVGAAYLGLVGILSTAGKLPDLEIPLLATLLPAFLAFVVLYARHQAIRRLSLQGDAPKKARKPRAVAIVGECEPIVARERMRAHSWSWWGRHWDCVAAIGAGCFYGGGIMLDPSSAGSLPATVPLLIFLGCIVMITPLRCLWRGLEVFQADRRAGTLESLMSTRITAPEALNGAAEVACAAPLRETVIVAAGILPLCVLLHASHLGQVLPRALGILVAVAYFAAPLSVTAAYLGIGAGVRGKTRQEAMMHLGVFWLQFYGAMGGTFVTTALLQAACGQTAALVAFAGMVLASPWVLLGWSRRRALAALRQQGDQVGFA